MSTRSYFPFLLLLLLSACEKKLSIPIPDEPVRPVLNALMNQDSIIYARATLSGRPGSGTGGFDLFPDADGAEVQLFEDGAYKETLQPIDTFGKKYYISTAKVVKGKSYRLTLKVPGYDVAEGTDIIPDREALTVYDAQSYLANTADGGQELNLKFALKNSSTAKEYYRIRLFGYNTFIEEVNGDTVRHVNRAPVPFTVKNEGGGLFDPEDGGDIYTGGVISEKQLEPGRSNLFTFASTTYYIDDADSFGLEVSVITEPTFRYLKTTQNAVNLNDDPTAEKVIIYTNIKNGLGIAGGMASKETYIGKP